MPTMKKIVEGQRLGIDKIETFVLNRLLIEGLYEQRERGYNSGFEHQNEEQTQKKRLRAS